MDVTFRPAGLKDLEPGVRVVQQAFSELRVRNGLSPVPLRPPVFQRFVMAEDPTGLWVAEADGAVIGFACSWTRQRFWYLSQVFVQPGVQARGIGQALMSRTLEQATRVGAENRALITLGYNMASTGLYIRNGLYPREPLYRLAAPAAALAGRLVADPATVATPLATWPGEQAWLGAVEEAVIGFRRETQHGFTQATPGMRGLRLDQDGRPAGYAYISAEGHVGPLLAAPGAEEARIALAAVHTALAGGSAQVSLVVPGRAERILAALSSLDFRIQESMLLMADRSFGDWSRYLPSNPGFM
jgi:GNAT superfamily N-acetyltransferase